MFDKLKQIKQLKELQGIIGKEKVETERDGVKIIINGRLQVEDVKLNPSLDQKAQEKILKDCFNEAVKKINIQIAQKMSKMPGLGLPPMGSS
ncbi:MAG: YbaB/EbfC family nucleoid-associated protein [Elusimicrobia bacterium]|nr:YbaB/EbfC family nucleoid-associated protein [Elusimicrobiota bacterium]